jgi:hypothetical protein
MINAQPRIQHVKRSPFPGEKVSEHEADHSSPSRTEVQNLWSYTSTPHLPSGQEQEQLYLYNDACQPLKDEVQTALFKDSVHTVQ